MCVLVLKNNKDGKPLSAKSRIVVLGTFKDRLYQKSQRYAPVLKYIPLRLLTAKSVGGNRILQKGDCKNVFYNSTLTYDGFTVIRPPIYNPSFQEDEYWILKKTLYGLRQYPYHYYNMIKGILLNMGLKASPHYPCLLYSVLSNPSYPDTIFEAQSQLHVSLYVNDFVFYSSYPTQESLFKILFQEHIQVNFMGYVDYLLGTAFTWLQHKDKNISVHIFRSSFTEFTAHWLLVQNSNKVPNMTPYFSGFHIHSILPVDPLNPDLPSRRQVYQIIVGCIIWLATCTNPSIAPDLIFLASYINSPHPQNYKAAFHAPKYLTSTNYYGI